MASENPAVLGGAPEASDVEADLPEFNRPLIKKQHAAPPPAAAISERRQKPGEASDGYPAVAACGHWRVVRCQGDIQWIIQYRHAGSATWPWRALAYVVNENLLPGVLERPSMGIPADDLDRLLAAWRAR